MAGKQIHAQPGYTYGKLTVIKDVGYQNRDRRVLVECECGAIKNVSVSNLRRGRSNSCGAASCRDSVGGRKPGMPGATLHTQLSVDYKGFYEDLYEYRESLDEPMSWYRLGKIVGVSPSTFTRLSRGYACDPETLLTLCSWAGLDPLHYARERETVG